VPIEEEEEEKKKKKQYISSSSSSSSFPGVYIAVLERDRFGRLLTIDILP
jgi:hypothetical protein